MVRPDSKEQKCSPQLIAADWICNQQNLIWNAEKHFYNEIWFTYTRLNPRGVRYVFKYIQFFFSRQTLTRIFRWDWFRKLFVRTTKKLLPHLRLSNYFRIFPFWSISTIIRWIFLTQFFFDWNLIFPRNIGEYTSLNFDEPPRELRGRKI